MKTLYIIGGGIGVGKTYIKNKLVSKKVFMLDTGDLYFLGITDVEGRQKIVRYILEELFKEKDEIAIEGVYFPNFTNTKLLYQFCKKYKINIEHYVIAPPEEEGKHMDYLNKKVKEEKYKTKEIKEETKMIGIIVREEYFKVLEDKIFEKEGFKFMQINSIKKAWFKRTENV